MIIFAVRSLHKILATGRAIAPGDCQARKVRTAQSNAPREQRGFLTLNIRKQKVPQKITTVSLSNVERVKVRVKT